MIIIEGRNGKSLKINEFLNYNKNNENIKSLIIIDNINNSLDFIDSEYLIIENYNELNNELKNEINNYDFLILYLNCEIDKIDNIEEEFKWFKGGILLTVQNNNLNYLKIYKF